MSEAVGMIDWGMGSLRGESTTVNCALRKSFTHFLINDPVGSLFMHFGAFPLLLFV